MEKQSVIGHWMVKSHILLYRKKFFFTLVYGILKCVFHILEFI